MIPAKRQQIILSALAERGILSIAELMEWLQVSHMTVRRDIQKLEEDGRVLSVSGGVQLTQKITSEPSHLVKRSLQHDEKDAIATMAASRVTAGMSIYLDAGTTSLALAARVASVPDLVVVSNDFAVVNLLMQQSECLLFHTGGQVLRENQSCVGDSATQFLKNLNIDIAFLSASSWNARFISTPTEAKVQVKKAAVEAASKRVLICDSTKYGKVGIFNAVPIAALDAIITDDRLPASARDALKQTGVEVVIADSSGRTGSGRKTS